LLKYEYLNFRLDILEYCDVKSIVKREQYYLDNLNLEYNTLKVARSKLGKPRSEITKLKLAGNILSLPLLVKNIETEEIHLFPSIRRTACFLSMHHSYLAKCLKKNNFYKGKGYYVIKN
jgi:hypothetical protein